MIEEYRIFEAKKKLQRKKAISYVQYLSENVYN